MLRPESCADGARSETALLVGDVRGGSGSKEEEEEEGGGGSSSSEGGKAAVFTALVQLRARQEDWHAGALDHSYYWSRLQAMSRLLVVWEPLGLSDGWARAWDEEKRSYYYAKPGTGESSW